MPSAVIYTAPGCFGCENIRRFFADHGVPYVERDISEDEQAFDEFERLGYPATPVSVVNGIAIWGYDHRALESALYRAKKIRP